ncbi:hypothetical protein BDR22DRAFT_826671 [Usnea florida]
MQAQSKRTSSHILISCLGSDQLLGTVNCCSQEKNEEALTKEWQQSSPDSLRSFCPFEDIEEERRSQYTKGPYDCSARRAWLISDLTLERLDTFLEIIGARNSRAAASAAQGSSAGVSSSGAAASPDVPALTKKLCFNECLDSRRGDYFQDKEVPNGELEKVQNRVSFPPKSVRENFDMDLIRNLAGERADMR